MLSQPKGSLSPPGQWIIVTSARFVHLFDSSIGPVRPARIVFKPDGKHTFEVLMTVTSSGSWHGMTPSHHIRRSHPYWIHFLRILDMFYALVLNRTSLIFQTTFVSLQKSFEFGRIQSGMIQMNAHFGISPIVRVAHWTMTFLMYVQVAKL